MNSIVPLFLFLFSMAFFLFPCKVVHPSPIESDSAIEDIDIAFLKQEIIARLSRVEEFKGMKKLAQELGISKVYLFGGTAASYAHYVFWNLEQEKGGKTYNENLFDYLFPSIFPSSFHSSQHINIVLDVENTKTAKQFEVEISKKYPYFQIYFQDFQRERRALEAISLQEKRHALEVRLLVRLLRKDFGNRKSLFGDDFLKQNTNSHSVGLIEITGNDPLPIRSLRNWEEENNPFIRDVHERTLHYYYDSSQHKETSRFREGSNPEIFSVILYLIKAFQFRLKIKEEDERKLKKVIYDFSTQRDLANPHNQSWIEIIGKRIYQNAVDVEYAYQTMERLNFFQEVLKKIRDDHRMRREPLLWSMSQDPFWWMNQEPLMSRSRSLGNPSKRKTAEELNIETVYRAFLSLETYELITLSPWLEPNVFVQEEYKGGEMGFVVRTVKEEVYYPYVIPRRFEIPVEISFAVNPKAVEGLDFILREGGNIVILNKSAFKVIPEQPLPLNFKVLNTDSFIETVVKTIIALSLMNNRGEIERAMRKLRYYIQLTQRDFLKNYPKWEGWVWFITEFIIKDEGLSMEDMVASVLRDPQLEGHPQFDSWVRLATEKGGANPLNTKRFCRTIITKDGKLPYEGMRYTYQKE